MQDNRMRFTLRMPKELYNVLRSIASEKGISTNSGILQILWEWVNNTTA